jgi:ribonuclease III
MRANLEALESSTGHRFTDREILHRALTHSSHANERNSLAANGAQRDNEQLEFLGDAILGFVISESLVSRFPAYPEGRLTKIKAQLVSAAHLFEIAQKLELGTYLQLGRGEEMTGGRGKRTLLADALEALIAAVYLDGGLDAARSFISQVVIGHTNGELAQMAESPSNPIVDFKTALQELVLARKLPEPKYVLVRQSGPEHAKVFTVEVRVGQEFVSQAEGSSKKSAAQKAAREIYEKLMAAAPGAAPPTEPRL